MGMIRVSDDVEKRLKDVADGRSMNSVIEKMLAYCSSPDGFCPTPQDTNEPHLLEHFDKRLDELKALIEDTTVDRLSSHPLDYTTRQALARVDVEWPEVQDLIYDFMGEKDKEWFSGMYNYVHQMNDIPDCYIKDDILYFNITGSSFPVLHVTPRIKTFLNI